MLRRLRTVSLIRLVFSLLVALALMAGSLEAGLPDVHERLDEAARSVPVLGSVGSESPSAVFASVRDERNVDACVSTPDAPEATCEAMPSSTLSEGPQGDQHRESRAPAHAFHLEHCGHAHNATRASSPQADEPCTEHAPRPIAPIATLRSVASTLNLRPPIA